MKRNRKDSLKKERAVMIASSAFVLAALTLTGVYMRKQNTELKDDGYTIDFAAMEESAERKANEIAMGEKGGSAEQEAAQKTEAAEEIEEIGQVASNRSGDPTAVIVEDELDYMPLEESIGEQFSLVREAEMAETEPNAEVSAEPVPSDASDAILLTPVIAQDYHFTQDSKLLMPVGDVPVLIPYSMEKSVYFKTLDQYRRSPGIVFQAAEGTAVNACAAGEVLAVETDAKLGHTVTLDLGDGYQARYGQLAEIQTTVGSAVEAGDFLGVVAAPTKYYSLEGSNLYFALSKDGESVDPSAFFAH